jgi:hypothetical protein
MITSQDGGRTWNLYPIATSPDRRVQTWAERGAIDDAGNVDVTWFDSSGVHFSMSHDAGKTWSHPTTVSAGISANGILPTISASRPGQAVITWYGTDHPGDWQSPAIMGMPGSSGGASWNVDWAETTDGGAVFEGGRLTSAVHRGAECTNGDACTLPNSRDLLDDFGVSYVGRSFVAAYMSDQPGGTAANEFVAYVSHAAH